MIQRGLLRLLVFKFFIILPLLSLVNLNVGKLVYGLIVAAKPLDETVSCNPVIIADKGDKT